MLRLFALSALLLTSLAVAAQEPFVLAPQVQAAPLVKTIPIGPTWAQAAIIPTFQLMDNTASPEAQTKVRVCHDGTRLYLGVICDESEPDKVQAQTAARDADIWTGDVVEVFIGTDDPRHFYHIMLNAAGSVCDEECRGEAKDLKWDADIEAVGGKGEGFWTVSASIALSDLGLTPGGPARGFNICRNRVPVRELSCWSPTLTGFHRPERFGELALGTGPAAMTVIDFGQAWPGDNTLKLNGVGGQPEARLELVAGDEVEPVALEPADGGYSYRFTGLGRLELRLEARAAGVLLCRQSTTVLVTDYRDGIAQLRARLAELPGNASELAGAREALAAVDALEKRATSPQEARPEDWPAVGDELTRLSAQVDTLSVEALAKAADADAGFGLGVQSPLVKMLRHDAFSGRVEAPIELRSARREYEAAQLVVFAFDEALEGVNLELPRLVSADGKSHIDARHLSWRHVQYIKTERPTYPVRFVGLWPDPLVPVESFDVAARGFESAWVTAYVPPGTPAGDYTGLVVVKAANAPERTVSLNLHVYDFTLPRTNHLKTSFGAGIGSGMDAHKWWDNMLDHRISPTSLVGAAVEAPRWDLSGFDRIAFSARLVAGRPGSGLSFSIGSATAGTARFGPIDLKETWQEFSLPLGAGREQVTALSLAFGGPVEATVGLRDLRAVGREGALPLVTAAEQWYAGAGSEAGAGDGEEVILRFSAASEGADGWIKDWPGANVSVWEAGNVAAKLDFSRFDSEMQRYLRRGLTAVCVPIPSAAYKQEKGTAVTQLRQGGTAALAKAWGAHLRSRGWLPLGYTYMADEPEHEFYATLNAILGEVHRGDPGLRNMMTARGAGAPELNEVDIWCPEVYSFNPDGAAQQQKRGKEVWWYVAFSTRHPFPNYWIDYPALDCRVHFWMTWKHKLDGILYWSINYRSQDNWKTAMCYPGANGDGHLTYPSADGGVVDSIRWEAIRDGAEDYEYFWMLSQAVKMAEARGPRGELLARARELLAIDDRVVRAYNDYNPDPAALVSERDEMAQVLEDLCHRLGEQPRDEAPRGTGATAGEDVSGPAAPALVDCPISGDAVVLQPATGAQGLTYRFETDAPYAEDSSGAGNHGIVTGGTRCDGRFGKGLYLDGDSSCIRLPSGETLLGARAGSGSMALWVKPDYDPTAQEEDIWSGWTVLMYIQKRSGNGLPDGYNEIGLSQHGRTLNGRITTTNTLGPYTMAPVPLKQGQWTHLALTWTPTERVLYVDGKQAARVTGSFEPVTLDGTAALVGMHPPTRKWTFRGAVDEIVVTPKAYSAVEVEKLAGGPAG